MEAALIAVLGAADRAPISAMLARAFADDPAMTFIFPDPVERQKTVAAAVRVAV